MVTANVSDAHLSQLVNYGRSNSAIIIQEGLFNRSEVDSDGELLQ